MTISGTTEIKRSTSLILFKKLDKVKIFNEGKAWGLLDITIHVRFLINA